jgi:hypothetical protein
MSCAIQTTKTFCKRIERSVHSMFSVHVLIHLADHS